MAPKEERINPHAYRKKAYKKVSFTCEESDSSEHETSTSTNTTAGTTTTTTTNSMTANSESQKSNNTKSNSNSDGFKVRNGVNGQRMGPAPIPTPAQGGGAPASGKNGGAPVPPAPVNFQYSGPGTHQPAIVNGTLGSFLPYRGDAQARVSTTQVPIAQVQGGTYPGYQHPQTFMNTGFKHFAPTAYHGLPNANHYPPLAGKMTDQFGNAQLGSGAPAHFQPPVPDTTYGPMQHLYVPRHDPAVVPGGPMPAQVCDAPFCSSELCRVVSPPCCGIPCEERACAQCVCKCIPSMESGNVNTNVNSFFHYPVSVPVGYHAGMAVHHQPISVTVPAQVVTSSVAINPVCHGTNAGWHVPATGLAPPPEIMGLGRTPLEMQAENHQYALANGAYDPCDIKPVCDDMTRMYQCRELDGNWTMRSLWTIEKMGCWRWYVNPDGTFYAVRLPPT